MTEPAYPSVERNPLDRVIGFFSPKAELDRVRSRMNLRMAETRMQILAGGYTGARSERRSMKEWSPGQGSADRDTLPQLGTLRGRSRDLVRNTPVATGAVNTAVTNVVGSGLSLHARIDREVLGLDDEEAEAWQRRAEMVWRAWAGNENCDLERTNDFAELQDLAFRSTLESGDLLVIRRYREAQRDVLGLKVQFIEADRVSNPGFRLDDDVITGGVEMDEDGAPVAYHVQSSHPGGRLYSVAPREWNRVPIRGEQSGERQSYLLYKKLRPGQRRGVPYLAPVMEPLKQLDRYTEAELMATVVSSMFTVFIQAEGEMTPPGGTDGFGLAPVEGDDEPDEGEYRLGSGMMVDLMPGESIETADPTRPNQSFDPFVEAILRQIGTSLEIPFELLVKHFTASYSAARAALLEAWKFFRSRRDWLARKFCQPSYEWVLAEAIDRGMLSAPGFFEDPVIRQAWAGAEWAGPAKGQIDPRREVEAAKMRVDNGFSSIQVETAEMTGHDWEDIHRQRVRENRMRREAGLDVESSAERMVTESTTGRVGPDELDEEDET